MSSLLDQADCKVLRGKLGLLGSNTHPLASEKVANDIPPLLPSTVTLNPDWGVHRNALLKRLALLGLGSFGLGAGVTGGFGLMNIREMTKDKPEALPGNVPVHMPISRVPGDKETEKSSAEIPTLGWQSLAGMAATHPMHIPWAVPALGAVGIGSMLGGSKLMNRILHNKMKSVRQQQLDAAQGDFDRAMLERYESPNLDNEKIGAALDSFYDELMEKDAVRNAPLSPGELAALAAVSGTGSGPGSGGGPSPPPPEYQGSEAAATAAPWLTAALLSGGFGLRSGYRWAEGRKPENLLRDAMRQRALIRAQSAPEPIQFAAPVGVRGEKKEQNQVEKSDE